MSKTRKKCGNIKTDKEEKWDVENSVRSLIFLSLIIERLRFKE